MRRVVVVVVAFVAMATTSIGLGIGVSPALAHALLTGSNPVNGAALATAPTRITLDYSESVQVSRDSIRVLDSAGTRVDDGHAGSGAQASEATVALRPGLPNGTYVASWRVISADSHPVSGAFAFGVGGPPDAKAEVATGTSGSSSVGFIFGVTRFLGYAGTALLLGVCFFLVVLWPAGLLRIGPRRLLMAGWGLSVFSAVAQLLLQGPYASGLGLGGLARWSVLSVTLEERFGQLLLIRLLALALGLPLLVRLMRGGSITTWGKGELAGLGFVVAVTLAMIGHGSAGDLVWLATSSLTLHVVAISVWIGGLVVIGVSLIRQASAPELAEILPRWSKIAVVSVCAVAASGVFQGWREIGSAGALIDTSYGRLLLYKLWFFVGMLALGGLAQRWVRRHYRRQLDRNGQPDRLPGATALAGLRRGVVTEIGVGAVVLGLTAVLVNMVPARTSYAPPFSGTAIAGPMTVKVKISPTRVGAQTVDVLARDPGGRPQKLVQASAELSLPSKDLGPITVPLTLTTPGHASSDGIQAPLPGEWQLRLTLRVNDFDQYVTTLFYKVR